MPAWQGGCAAAEALGARAGVLCDWLQPVAAICTQQCLEHRGVPKSPLHEGVPRIVRLWPGTSLCEEQDFGNILLLKEFLHKWLLGGAWAPLDLPAKIPHVCERLQLQDRGGSGLFAQWVSASEEPPEYALGVPIP